MILAHTGAMIIKIGTDLDSTGRVRPSAPIPNTVDWTNQLGVVQIAALLEQASVFVGIDSGPLHIAGVLGVPSVGLFGPVSAKLRLHPDARVTVVVRKVDCLGCHHRPAGHLHWKTGCPNDIACMREITAKEVFAAVADHLGAGDRPLEGGQITLASNQI
jgi:ADP-heptose:LPS heptosyltransferase